jgi:hypothetical protein
MDSERIAELVEMVPRIKDMYNVGPVQRAAIEDFVDILLEEYADSLVLNAMSDPRYVRAMDKFYENKWGHRFD